MSNNVRLYKQQSQPNSSTPSNPTLSTSSILQLQHHVSLEFPARDRESIANLKDLQPHTVNSQPGIKKLASLLDPRKELCNSLSPSYTSPKSFLGNNSIANKTKASGSSFENSNLNLISPKDLVRLAMSKHKSKPIVKKVPAQSASTANLQRNARKSLCVRTGPGESRSQKRDRSNSKLASTSVLEENSMLSKTFAQDKSAKLKRMKLIYNDLTPSEIAKFAKSTIYTPNEASGRMRQGTITPNRSNSGLLWPASPSGNVSLTSASNKKVSGKLGASQQIGYGGSDKVLNGKENEENEKLNVKRGSIENINSFLKESKPLAKQGKRMDKKSVQPRQLTIADNAKTHVSSFSRVMSQTATNQDTMIERAKSPTVLFNAEEDETTNSNLNVLEASDFVKDQEFKPREEFITDLKNWVNDIVKSPEETPVQAQKKNPAVTEKVKEVQEGMLAKLREALDNDEFVRREDYERLYEEKEGVEEELDALKEENAQLRAMMFKMQQENEAREIKMSSSLNTSYDPNIVQQLQEALTRQNQELEQYKQREKVVQNVLKMIWQAGIQIGDLNQIEMPQETPHQPEPKQKVYQPEHGWYEVESGRYVPSPPDQEPQIAHQFKPHAGPSSPKHFNPQPHMKHMQLVKQDFREEQDSALNSQNLIALSDLGDSEADFTNRQLIDSMVKSPNVLVHLVKKSGTNPKSTADSSPLFSAKLIPAQNAQNAQNYAVSKAQDKLKIDLTGLGGNLSLPKSNVYSSQDSVEKGNKHVVTEGPQTMGFHEEFMSKLDEFSQSWRNDALAYQKF